MSEREVLEQLETALAGGTIEAPEVPVCVLAGRAVAIPDDEARGAARRAVELLAAGGDPYRGLDPNGRAVQAVAGDLDDAERRTAFTNALVAVRDEARGLPRVTALVDRLLADGDLAWSWFACTVLAEELAAE